MKKSLFLFNCNSKNKDKPELLTKDLLESLFGSKDNKINSIIICLKFSIHQLIIDFSRLYN